MTTLLCSYRIKEEIPSDSNTADCSQINYEINHDIQVDSEKITVKAEPGTEEIHIKEEFDPEGNFENGQEDPASVNDTTELQQHITVPTKLEIKSEIANLEFVAIKSELTECEYHNDVSPSNKSDHSKCPCKLICSISNIVQARIPCPSKALKCNQCEFTTHDQATLRTHLETHRNILSCQICEFKTTLKRSLKRHMKDHNRERTIPFQCNLCDYTTLYTYNIRTHMKTHAQYSALCAICGCQFRNNYLVRQHVKRLHEESC